MDIEELKEKIKELPDNCDFTNGYVEAILNLLGEYPNLQCTDCPFSDEGMDYTYTIYGEGYIICTLGATEEGDGKCWIEIIKLAGDSK